MRDSPGSQWFHYTLWEDWHAGLYRQATPSVALAEKVAALLKDATGFAAAMIDVGATWPVATTHNLSNETRNHRPWLGRSSACFRYAAAIADTNLAWSMLTQRERDAADREADTYCSSWRALNLRGQLRFTI